MSLGEMSVIIFCTPGVVVDEAILLESQKNPDQKESQVSIVCIARDVTPFLATLYVGLIALCSMLGGGWDFMAHTTFELPPGKV